jgi:hypothetical protein
MYSVHSSVSSKNVLSLGLEFGYLWIKRMPDALLPRAGLFKKIWLVPPFFWEVPRPELNAKLTDRDSG